MLKVRVIPTLLCKGAGLVKGIGFDSGRRVGSVLPAIKVYNNRDVDELMLMDIEAHLTGEGPDVESISDFADACFVPFTVGGGITQVEQIAKLLRAGADKVSINTAACEIPGLVRQAAQRFGAQCIVASIDVRRMPDSSMRCFSRSGTRDTGKHPVSWAKELQDMGAGEILITSISRDGTMRGYDLELIAAVAQRAGDCQRRRGQLRAFAASCARRRGRSSGGGQHVPLYRADPSASQVVFGSSRHCRAGGVCFRRHTLLSR